MTWSRFARYAWSLLAYNLVVILWGAVVSSTGAGAGCGEHWPDCNGQFVPVNPTLATLIEFSHRLSSGLDGVLVIVLVVWAFRQLPAQPRICGAALASFGFVLIEGLIGALLVRQGWTALDTSVERLIMQPLHLINTLFLLAALTLTAWWASDGAPIRISGQGLRPWLISLGLLGVMCISGSGAIISLGDFLDQQERVRNEALVPLLVNLRLWHPAIAITVGVGLIVMALSISSLTPNSAARRWAYLTVGLVLAQWCVGFLNVYLRVPLWTQLVHLVLADLTWITLILWSASALSDVSLQPRLKPINTIAIN
ncbi:MAG: COX15/CtaA family protein [Anaerolineales bacterium]